MHFEFVNMGSDRQILSLRIVRNAAFNQPTKVRAFKTGETINLESHPARSYEATRRLRATRLQHVATSRLRPQQFVFVSRAAPNFERRLVLAAP